eukprot:4475671-Pleurochrysis_carterae.AAC.1
MSMRSAKEQQSNTHIGTQQQASPSLTPILFVNVLNRRSQVSTDKLLISAGSPGAVGSRLL